MIAYIRGNIGYIDAVQSAVILEAGGVGYRIFMTAGDLELLPGEGEEARIYIYLQVREDAFVLYGFLTRDDRRLFEQLLGVSGVGPKAALGILSALSPDEFRFAVLSDDPKTVSKAPGIGIKTAKKIILELKDKLDLEETFESALAGNEGSKQRVRRNDASGDARAEAVEALCALGYSSAEALRAVRQVEAPDDADTGTILKGALKFTGM